MEIVLSLITIYCQNHFNYKGCLDDKRFCIENYVSEAVAPKRFSLYDKRILSKKENNELAKAYHYCVNYKDYACE